MRVALILTAVAITASAGCSSTTSKPSAPAAAATGAAAATVTGSQAPAPQASATTAAPKLKVGMTTMLATPSGPLEVTLVKVIDPAKPAESYISPAKGEHWIGVQFRFVNKGSTAFVDSPLTGLDASDAQGQSRNSFPDQEIQAGPMIDPLAGVHLQPGDTKLGFIVYSVPDGVKLAQIQYTPPGGSTAEWTLG